MNTKRPPLGLVPRHIWNEQRINDIRAAIAHCMGQGGPVPEEWIEEYNALVINAERSS